MELSFSHLLSQRSFLKIGALVIAYGLWFTMSTAHTSSLSLSLPIGFYNTSQALHIQAPTDISLSLVGPREALAKLDINSIAVHIDAEKLSIGTHPYVITRQDLLLPAAVSLHDHVPSTVMISTNCDTTTTTPATTQA